MSNGSSEAASTKSKPGGMIKGNTRVAQIRNRFRRAYVRSGIHRYGALPKLVGGFLLLFVVGSVSGTVSGVIDGTMLSVGLSNIELIISYIIGGALLAIMLPALLLGLYYVGRVVASKSPHNTVRGYHWTLIILFALVILNYAIESSIGKKAFEKEYLQPAFDSIIYGPLFFFLGPFLVVMIVVKGMGGRIFNLK